MAYGVLSRKSGVNTDCKLGLGSDCREYNYIILIRKYGPLNCVYYHNIFQNYHNNTNGFMLS